jgi:hypothetical protein
MKIHHEMIDNADITKLYGEKRKPKGQAPPPPPPPPSSLISKQISGSIFSQVKSPSKQLYTPNNDRNSHSFQFNENSK